MFLSTFHPQPILAHLGPLTIHWYGFLLAIGALAGFLLLLWLAKPYKIDVNFLYDLFVVLVIGGFLGGRLYHVTNEWPYYSAHPGDILKIWNGGLAIHGAIIAGVLLVWWMARRKKISTWLMLDLLVPALALGQAIGRWGNYFNQELFGRATSVAWKLVIDPANRPIATLGDMYYHPTFLYESIGCLLLAALLIILIRSRQRGRSWSRLWKNNGTIFATYLVLYSAVRVIAESFRIDRVPIILGIRLPLITSVVLIVIGLTLFIWLTLSRAKRRS